MFTFNIKTDNAAFTENYPAEMVRILHELADKVEAGDTKGMVYDVNGNIIGSWVWMQP